MYPVPVFTISLFTPPPNCIALAKDLLIPPGGASITLETQIPGGFSSCTVSWPVEVMLPPGSQFADFASALRGFAHVVISAFGSPIWKGRLMEIDRDAAAGVVTGFRATGYGLTALKDGTVSALTQTGLVTSGVIVAETLNQIASYIQPAVSERFVDPGIAHALSEFNAMDGSNVIDQLSKEATPNGILSSYAVWGGMNVADLAFEIVPQIPPAQPDYIETPDATFTQWRETYDDTWAGVTVEYQPSQNVTTTLSSPTDARFAALYGLLRTAYVQGGQITAAAAEGFIQAFMSLAVYPAHAITIEREGGRGLAMLGGQDRAPWLTRAGEWVQVTNTEPELLLPIQRTSWSSPDNKLSVYVGRVSNNLADLLQEMRTLDRKFVQKINPVTGGFS